MMTLDDAIISIENRADLLEESAAGCDLCDSVEKKIAYRSGKRAREFRQLAEWLKDYKRLKEQEPCEYAISRKEVLDEAFEVDTKKYGWIDVVGVDAIEALPPVTPQQKTGRWIDDNCSECGKGIEDLIDSPEWHRNEKPNFCPFCGVKMQEVEE